MHRFELQLVKVSSNWANCRNLTKFEDCMKLVDWKNTSWVLGFITATIARRFFKSTSRREPKRLGGLHSLLFESELQQSLWTNSCRNWKVIQLGYSWSFW